MRKRLGIIYSCLMIIGTLFIASSAQAASFSLNTSTQQITPGGKFTISVGGDCVGRVNLTVSNGSAASGSVWVEENYQTVDITAGSSGTITVTATPEPGLSDSDGNTYSPGARSVSVKIVAPAATPSNPENQGTTQTNTTTTSSPKPQTTAQPASNSTNQNSGSNTNEPENAEAPETTETASEPENVDTDEVAEGTDDEIITNNDESCPKKCPETWLPWTLAGVSSVALLIVLGVLVYIMVKCPLTPSVKQSTTQKNANEKTQ